MKNKKSNIVSSARLWVVILVVIIASALLSFVVFAEDGLDTTKEMLLIDLEGADRVEIEITDINSLIEADLALLRWGSMGNSTENKDSEDIVKGVFGGQKVYGYWNVYEKIYAELLAYKDPDGVSSADKILYQFKVGDAGKSYNVPSGKTRIYRLNKNNQEIVSVYFSEIHSVKGTLIIIAEDAAEFRFYNSSNLGGIKVEEGGTLVIQGPSKDQKITIKGNETKRDKNALEVQHGDLYLNNCVFDGFKYNILYNSTICFTNGNNTRHLYMSNCTMQNVSSHIKSDSKWGSETGGILCMVYNADKITVTNSDGSKTTITDPENGKAEQTALYINNCLFDNCDTNKGGTVNGNGIGGGAIRSYAADRSNLYVYNSTFKNNDCTATGPSSGGGAVYWKSANGEAHLTKCKFENNSATLVGGAIYNTGIMYINACTFEENKATHSGGAIAVEPPNTSAPYAITPTSGSLTLDSATKISGNTAEERGGGIYFNAYTSQIGSGNTITSYAMTLTINGSTIENNTADYGGGVAMWLNYDSYDYKTGITIGDGSAIKNNTANIAGGAIWMNSDPYCDCNENDGVTMNGGTLENNTAPDGGAIYIGAGKTTAQMAFNMTGGTAKLNGVKQTGETVTENGGAIYMTQGTCTLSGGTIENCIATENGGGVYLGGGNLIVSGGKLLSNKAQNGAGAYVNASAENDGVTVYDGEIKGNIAQQNGGGIEVNNGFYKMAGGSVDGNRAENGNGGGIYVSATKNVEVEIRSGSVSSNYAGEDGAAVSVVGPKTDNNITFTVTLGVNTAHYDENDVYIPCDHNFDGQLTQVTACPVLENNTALKRGGGIYISGGKETKLNTYCLVEENNRAADGVTDNNGNPVTDKASKSDFMMVEGGTVLITTADETGANDRDGHIVINNTIHVEAGVVTLDGSMSNPLIKGEITVDITNENDKFTDNRDRTEAKYFTVQYFENFVDPDTKERTGRYTVITVAANTPHTISATLYEHPGYMIDGWWTSKDTDTDPNAKQYLPGDQLTIDTDYVLYAKWLPNGYWVYFDPGVNGYSGEEMPTDTRFTKDKEGTLHKNTYFVPGKVFVGWDTDGDGNYNYVDEATVINLTTERSITLVAVWRLCTHEEALFTTTYEKSGDKSLTRTCTCKQCTQTATIIAKDTVYNEKNQQARLEVTSESGNGVDTTAEWKLTLKHTGTKIDSQDEPEIFGTDAGEYTAWLEENGQKLDLEVEYTIAKATQTAPPEPSYRSKETDSNTELGKIVIINAPTERTDELNYKVVWYSSGSILKEDTKLYAEATSGGFELKDNYTNYYVYVQYIETDNYLSSEWVMAKEILFFEGSVYIHIVQDKGIECLSQPNKDERGLTILIKASETHFLYNLNASEKTNTLSLPISNSTIAGWEKMIVVGNIPDKQQEGTRLDLVINITGAKPKVIVTPYVGESEIFGEVSTKSATIKRDSAYTAYFEVNNFDSGVYDSSTLSLSFSTALPSASTVIMVDKSAQIPVYYYYIVPEQPISSVLLTAFMPMVAGTSFSSPTGTTLKYQFIIDFSDCASYINVNEISTYISASRKSGEADKGVPEFPSGEAYQAKTTLENCYSASLTVIDSTTQVKIVYPSTTDAKASKWLDRAGALVLTAPADIPTDARISATDGNWHEQFRPNANGEFIIPIAKFDCASKNITFTLISDFFPQKAMDYTFTVQLISACSQTALSPKNGQVLSNVQITFRKAEQTAPPSISITPIKDSGPSNIYDYNTSVSLKVDCLNEPEGTELVLRLLNKNDKNVYLDAGWKAKIDNIETPASVPLGTLTGSCCLILELRDTAGNVLMTAEYYFIIVEQ